MSKNDKINKHMVPQGFTMALVIVDMIPVVFFGASTLLLGHILQNTPFIAASAICFLSGFLKVVWKYIVVKHNKNVWPLFIQMRIVMPVAFIAMIAVLFVPPYLDNIGIFSSIIMYSPSLPLYILGFVGMLLMTVFSFVLDSSNKNANWIEQFTNGMSQMFIFMALLLYTIHH